MSEDLFVRYKSIIQMFLKKRLYEFFGCMVLEIIYSASFYENILHKHILVRNNLYSIFFSENIFIVRVTFLKIIYVAFFYRNNLRGIFFYENNFIVRAAFLKIYLHKHILKIICAIFSK